MLAVPLLAAALLAPGRALAQDDATTIAARDRFKEGVAYFDQKQFEKARAAFLQAYALKRHPAVLLNLAQSELRSGHERDAAEHFEAYLRETTDASAQEREGAEAGLSTAKAAVGEIGIASSATGATVLVDGNEVGSVPLAAPVFLDPGSHQLELRQGSDSATRSVSVKAGERQEVTLAFGAASRAAPQKEGPPGGETSSATPEETHADHASVSLSSGGRQPFFSWLFSTPAGYAPAGAAVLFGLGSGGLALASRLSYNQADDTATKISSAARDDGISTQGVCKDPAGKLQGIYSPESLPKRAAEYDRACSAYRDDVDSGDRLKTFAIVAGIGAGAMVATTAVLYFVTAPQDSEAGAGSGLSSARLLPYLSPGSGGLSLSGTF